MSDPPEPIKVQRQAVELHVRRTCHVASVQRLIAQVNDLMHLLRTVQQDEYTPTE